MAGMRKGGKGNCCLTQL